MNVLDDLHELLKAGRISDPWADQAKTVYRAFVELGHDPILAEFATLDVLREKSPELRDYIEFCAANPDRARIEEAKTAMREQWREARAGRMPN